MQVHTKQLVPHSYKYIWKDSNQQVMACLCLEYGRSMCMLQVAQHADSKQLSKLDF